MSEAQLAEVPKRMAQTVRPLFEAPTIDRYARYLNLMVHYTRTSKDDLQYAASLFSDSALFSDSNLRDLFAELAREEATHYRLAEADLDALGIAVSPEAPAEVLAFRKAWFAIQAERAPMFLGVGYALEGVAAWLKEDALQTMGALGLDASTTHFVRAHLSADDEHGALLEKACREHFKANGALIVEGAALAERHWTAIHLAALSSDDKSQAAS